MKVALLGIDEISRLLLPHLLTRGDVETVIIISDDDPTMLARQVTRDWAGDATRIEGVADGQALKLRGRYGRGGLREDCIPILSTGAAIHDGVPDDVDVCVTTDLAEACRLLPELAPPLIGWTWKPDRAQPWTWPWDTARSSARIVLPPADLAVGVGLLVVAAGVASIVAGSVVSSIGRGELGLPRGDESVGLGVLGQSWNGVGDRIVLDPQVSGIGAPIRFARTRGPTARGGAVAVSWQFDQDRAFDLPVGDDPLEAVLQRASRRQMRNVLIQTCRPLDSTAAFGARAMGVVTGGSRCGDDAWVDTLGGLCHVAVSAVDAPLLQLTLVLDQLVPGWSGRAGT